MPCQRRNASSRQSVIHSGSPFFSEIRRTMSSLMPLGAYSISISVSQPYL